MITIEKKFVKAGNRVSTPEVDNLIRTYKQERWADNSKKIGKEDALSVWFDIDGLQEFIDTVRTEGGDGVRIFFGAHAEDDQKAGKMAGRQNLVMVGQRTRNEVTKDIYTIDGSGKANIVAWGDGRPCPPFCHDTDGKGILADDGVFQQCNVGVTIIDKGEEGMILV